MPFLYHANEVLKRRHLFKTKRDFDFAVFGSLATDLEHLAGVKGAHERSLDFYHFLLKNKKRRKYAKLGLGMYIHSITDDYIEPTYVDAKRNKEIATEIIKKYDPGKEKMALAPHLLIEQAIDYNISHDNKELIEVVNKALRRGYKRRHFENMTKYIEEFFGVDRKIIQQKLQLINPDRMIAIARIEQYTSIKGQVQLWTRSMFFWKDRKAFINMHKITVAWKYLTYMFKQDKAKIKDMIKEAKDKWNDFHGIIKGFKNKLDRDMKAKLKLLYKA